VVEALKKEGVLKERAEEGRIGKRDGEGADAKGEVGGMRWKG
jgi:hypothetical protein